MKRGPKHKVLGKQIPRDAYSKLSFAKKRVWTAFSIDKKSSTQIAREIAGVKNVSRRAVERVEATIAEAYYKRNAALGRPLIPKGAPGPDPREVSRNVRERIDRDTERKESRGRASFSVPELPWKRKS